MDRRKYLRVLLIDDDEKFLKINRQVLEKKYGWPCEVALSGKEGIQRLEEASELPDVVVVDLSMPDMDGYAVIKAIREKWDYLCVVALTGSANYLGIQNALKAVNKGADDYLTKPIEYDALILRLQIAYEYKRLREREVEDILTLARGFMHQIGPRLTTVIFILRSVEKLVKRNRTVRQLIEKAVGNLKRAQGLIDSFRRYPVSMEKGEKIHLSQRVKAALDDVKEMQHFTYGDLDQFQIVEIGFDNASCIMGSSDLIKETFVNLFNNAFQAMNQEEKRLQISLRETPEGMVEVKITDSGGGILEADREHIFEPFFTTRKGKGTGIGLYFAKTVIDQYGGRISVDSEVGKGTTFTVTLSIAPAETNAAP